MTADLWGEDARGIWQSQESVVTRMSAEDMRERADRWDRAFRGTNWIAFACAGVLLLFFTSMLAIHQTTLQRTGAAIGIAAGLYLVFVGVRVAQRGGSKRGPRASAPTNCSWNAGGWPTSARPGPSCCP